MKKIAPLVPLALALALALAPLLLLLQLQLIVGRGIQSNDKELTPVPAPWPDRFHALLYMNVSGIRLQITDLWYDWPKGRNVNIMQKQLGELLYDVEWNNGTSFYYTQGEGGHCTVMLFGVGIPRPNWLVDGAIYLGTEYTDGFLCNVWKKVDFIWYYEDVVTKIPVRWDFYDGISTHVITYEVGAELDDSRVQAPAYCFSQKTDQQVHESQIPTAATTTTTYDKRRSSSRFPESNSVKHPFSYLSI